MWSLESRYCCYVFVDRALILGVREGLVMRSRTPEVLTIRKGGLRRAKLDDAILMLNYW